MEIKDIDYLNMKANKEVLKFINLLLDELEPNGQIYNIEFENYLDNIQLIKEKGVK